MSEVETEQFAKPQVAHKKIKAVNIILIVVLLCVQIFLVVLCVNFEPKPLDTIERYEVTTVVQEDGKMKNSYRIWWRVLDDSSEGPLSWLQIGMSNRNFTVQSVGGNARAVYKYNDNYARIDLDKTYYAGMVADVSFTVIQDKMLCENANGYFFEFVPGWFDTTPIENYVFKWQKSDGITTANSDAVEGDFHIWSGSLESGVFVKMNVEYAKSAFVNAAPIAYVPFEKYESGDISEKAGFVIAMIFVILIILLIQICLLNATVGYYRGRGFFPTMFFYSGRGGRGGHGGGGCACASCACACACAGGGRAGCSQKDLYKNEKEREAD